MKKFNYSCDFCGKPIYKKPNILKKNKYSYCSLECTYNHRKLTMVGAGNHQYGKKGSLNASWKSDEKITNYGYKKIRCLDHPFADCDGFVFEHRLILEQEGFDFLKYGVQVNGKYYIDRKYDVHHIDCNKLNNVKSNLQILTKEEHMKVHAKEQGVEKVCKYCNNIFYASGSKKDSAKFCSKECLDKSKANNTIISICPICGTEFAHSKKQYRKCCSVECSNKYLNRGATIVQCSNCGIDFKIKKSRLEKSDKVFCKKECYYEFRRK